MPLQEVFFDATSPHRDPGYLALLLGAPVEKDAGVSQRREQARDRRKQETPRTNQPFLSRLSLSGLSDGKGRGPPARVAGVSLLGAAAPRLGTPPPHSRPKPALA